MTVTIEGIGVFVSLVIGVSVILGIVSRLVLLPWLKTQIADPLAAQIGNLSKDLDATTAQIKTIHHEVTPNGGGSIKDAVRRLEAGQVRTEEKLSQLSDDQAEHEARQSAETAKVASEAAKVAESVEYVRRRLDDHLAK